MIQDSSNPNHVFAGLQEFMVPVSRIRHRIEMVSMRCAVKWRNSNSNPTDKEIKAGITEIGKLAAESLEKCLKPKMADETYGQFVAQYCFGAQANFLSPYSKFQRSLEELIRTPPQSY